MEYQAYAPSKVVEHLQRAGHLLRTLLAPHFAEFGLTDIRYTALKIIQAAPERECTQSHLAKALEQSESSVSTLVERMRSDGWLYRLTSITDRRKRVLMLSDKGREALEKIESCHEERLGNLIGRLPYLQQQQLNGLLDELVEGLAKAHRESESVLTPAWMSVSEKRAA